MQELRLDSFARGAPFHAALVSMSRDAHTRSALHRHVDFCELMLVLRGRGQHAVNGTRQPLAAGDLLFVRADDQHAIDPVGRETLGFVNLAVPLRTWRRTSALAGVPARSWSAPTLPPATRLAAGHELSRVEREFRLALLAFQSDPRPVDLAPALTVAIASLRPARPAGLRAAGPAWLSAALEQMREPDNLVEGLPALLRLTAVSHGHLARSMRRFYGCTPLEYLLRLRLQHASLLLNTTDEPIGAIAAACGFTSASYFARRFKTEFGHSARAHRGRHSQVIAPVR